MPPIRSWRSPKVEVRDGSVAGLGVFAREPVVAGEIVAVKAGHIVHRDEVVRLTTEIGDQSLQIYDDLYLSPRTADEIDETSIRINHSCDANVGFRGQVLYVAIRNIGVDEELCHDYAMDRTDDYCLECACGTLACRGTVTGEDWRLPEVQARYEGFFVEYVAEKIRRATAD
ncbi:MAG: SET domain-containing protein-lysine N-methyltransferase [Actinomycetota bacterium]|nr:SET domain-containing protein-lysine N-methyltransferase [Actinomycetota bacterium]MEC9057837.1 SET domain-containing protein-lysine N-methyltransferase [Actinomycetota bacterium]MED5166191.1 SET domain-containing protein-lysine N-methyltransferase [Actinomycetota bacterium]MED5397653.1 SET domain-containing protein-lysine N-methyltransferase [Actinomycetota bacterium]MED5439517.1 SET domain-containing protein-lysine N-methyltransferase [Actinomycetota bacterium]